MDRLIINLDESTEPSNKLLTAFYELQFHKSGVDSADSLAEAVEQGLNLSFDISELIPPEKQLEIVKNNPDSVEIGEKMYEVSYKYDPYHNRHTASIAVPVEEIFDIEVVPPLPSGRPLGVRVTDGVYERFSGEEIETLRKDAERYLLDKQWETFKYSADAPKEQKLADFDPISGSVPELPEPVAFGTNPRTHEPEMSYPALSFSPPYWSNNIPYSVRYYKTREEAQQAQEQALEQIENTKEEKRKEDERQRMFAPAKAALSEIQEMSRQIQQNYGAFNLSWSEIGTIQRLISNVEYELESDPEGVLKKIAEIRNSMASAFEMKRKKEEMARQIDELIADKYSLCPLCGGNLSDGFCQSGKHELERVEFETDEWGRETGPVILSQIKVVTDDSDPKIVARLMCSAGTGRRYNKGDIYLEKGTDLGFMRSWQGELGDVVFEDFDHIITLEKLERQRLEELQRPLPEGVIRIGYSLDRNNTFVYAIKDEYGIWRLCTLSKDGTPAGYRGMRSLTTSFSPEQLIKEFYKGDPEKIKKALTDYAVAKAAAEEEKRAIDAAFDSQSRSKGNYAAVTKGEEGTTGVISKEKRHKLEKELLEAENKLTGRMAELEGKLRKEKSTALDVSKGETDIDIAKKGAKVVADFDKVDTEGNRYAEIIIWPTDKVLHLRTQGLQGKQYVELMQQVEGGEFHSEELGLDGITFEVKKVDLSENDETAITLQEKIIKYRTRLGQ
jgi:hypothetical protein